MNKTTGFRKLSEIVSIDDSSDSPVFLINGQWRFTLPSVLFYETDGEFEFIEGGIDMSGSKKPLILKEIWSMYGQKFCAAVEPHSSFVGNYRTVVECKYDNRFGPDETSNSRRVIIDEPDFYVDLIAVNTWPFGTDVEIRVRGEDIEPYNIKMMVNPDNKEHWEHIADFFREIADSVCRVAPVKKSAAGKPTAPAKKPAPVSNPNCIISGTVLQRYIGQEADVVLPAGITELADNIFSGSDNLRSVVIPEGVETIGNRAFENCFSLESVTLPESLRSIGRYAFVDCQELKHINFGSNLEYIGGSAFSECYKLQNVTLPASLKSIDAFVFKNCREFTRLTIPEGVRSIGFTAFVNCNRLAYLYIPASVTAIQDNIRNQTPFDGCTSLTIHCPAGSCAAEYAASHGIRYVIDNAVPQAPKPAVKAAPRETAKTPPQSVAVEPKQSVNAVELPDDGWSIAVPEGFSYSKDANRNGESQSNPGGVYELIIAQPKSKASVDYLAPYSNRIAFVTLNRLNARTAEQYYEIKADEWVTLKDEPGLKVRWLLLSTVQLVSTYQVMVETEKSVRRCQIMINARQKKEEKAAFVVRLLSTIQLTGPGVPKPAGKKATGKKESKTGTPTEAAKPAASIDGFCLLVNGKLLEKYNGPGGAVVVPDGVTEIGGFAFENAPVTSVVLPDSVEKIGPYAFADCEKLEKINIPDRVTSVGMYAFSNCSALKEIKLPSGVTFVEMSAFQKCSALKEIVWPGSVKTLPNSVCSNCGGLVKAVLEEGITEAEGLAFGDCTGLKDIYLPRSLAAIGQYCLPLEEKPTLHVYSGSFAHGYAKENKLPVVLVSAPEQEAKTKRQKTAENKQQKAEEAKQKREEKRRLEAEEKARKAAEEAECQRKAEEEARRKKQEEADRRQQEFEAQIIKSVEEAERQRKAEEAQRKQWEENVRRQREQEELARKAAEEAERQRKAAEEAARKKRAEWAKRRLRYDELCEAISEQLQIISQNRFWFGAQAKARKAAKEKLAVLEAQLEQEFPEGRP